MLSPHFVYPIAGTSWYIVISKGAKHFYYDTETKESVWQIGDTGISDLQAKVNFDDLAILFAKSNGVDFSPKNQQIKPSINQNTSSSPQKSDVGGTQESPDQESINAHHNLESRETTLSEDEKVKSDGIEADLNSEQPPEATSCPAPGMGLSLGYSSSEEEPSDVDQESDLEDSKDSSDVNSGLDLGLDDEYEVSDSSDHKSHHSQQIEEFEAILNRYKDDISEMDPWMLVEEDLLSKFSQHAAFYNVPEPSMRERIFNNWIIKRNKDKQQEAKKTAFPTDTLRFYRFLQTNKSEVKKMYYVEFERNHKSELDSYYSTGCDLESLYRQLRVTLNDFSALEKAQKTKQKSSAKPSEKNLKVVHVENFLAEQNLSKYASNYDIEKLDADADFFDQWMQICNFFSLPESLVHDPRNFILGDEKRVVAYKKGLQNG